MKPKHLGYLMAALLCLSLGNFVQAQNYPNKPIRIIVPFPPGETGDIMSRLVGPKLSELLGQPIIVENRPGASGIIGLDAVAKSVPDGYTIGLGQGGTMTTLPYTKTSMPYNAIKDFSPITISTLNYLGIVANNNAPFKNLSQMIEWAKANPGKLTLGTNGEGGFPHLAFEHLAQTANFKFTHVPYKGASQIITDLAGGQVMIAIGGISSITPSVRSGLITMIAITNKTRISSTPDFPTVSETIPGWDSNGWFGYVGPAGLSPQIVNKLNEGINLIFKDPKIIESMTQSGLIVVTQSPQYAIDLIKSENDKYRKLVQDIGFKPQ